MSSYSGPDSDTAQRIREAISAVQTDRRTHTGGGYVPATEPFPQPPADAEPLLRRQPNTPYVGDIPGGVRPPADTQAAPYRQDPSHPKLTIPGVQMTIWMVWVVDDEDPDQVPWLAGARDDASVQADPEDWEDSVQEVRDEHGSILITRTSVDYGKVRAAFEPLDI